jgi:hypothetical protein
MTSAVIFVKVKGKVNETATYIGNICTPRTPIISGMSSIIMLDILFQHQEVLSVNKFDLGLVKNVSHKIDLTIADPFYGNQATNSQNRHWTNDSNLE